MDSREAQSQSTHHQHHQHQPFPMNSYHLPNNSNSSMYNPNSVSNNNNMMMQQQQQQQQQHQQQQEPRFPFNQVMFPPSSKPYDSLNHNNINNNSNNSLSYDMQDSGLAPCSFSLEQPEKRKRGRPKKYTAEGNIALGLSQAPTSPLGHDDFSAPVAAAAASLPSGESQVKRGRGRPPGSGKKQLDALGPSGVGFTPHVITIQPGEDIASKIMAFSQQGTRTVCILSANGAVCNVTLRQPSLPNGNVTYEERFEIISLSGSFSRSESNGSQCKKAGLSISFAAPDGRVMGGAVAGVLVAATPVQVILGSFAADGKKPNSATTPPSAPPGQMLNFGGAAGAAASPSSHGGSNDSSDENGSSPLDGAGYGPTYNNGNQPIHSMPSYPAMWGSPNMNIHPN